MYTTVQEFGVTEKKKKRRNFLIFQSKALFFFNKDNIKLIINTLYT